MENEILDKPLKKGKSFKKTLRKSYFLYLEGLIIFSDIAIFFFLFLLLGDDSSLRIFVFIPILVLISFSSISLLFSWMRSSEEYFLPKNNKKKLSVELINMVLATSLFWSLVFVNNFYTAIEPLVFDFFDYKIMLTLLLTFILGPVQLGYVLLIDFFRKKFKM
jgi:predicted neutral ceramidase superfamily lipid hydrolase